MSSSSQTGGSLGNHRVSLGNVSLSEGSVGVWRDSVAALEQYVAENEDKMLVFKNNETGEFSAGLYAHRFRESYTKMQYAKIQGFCRGALAEYEDPHLAILTLSSSSLTATGDPRPPIDHLNDVLGSWENGVYYELRQVMDGNRKTDPWSSREWEYLWILEPHTDAGRVPGGYGHVHIAVVADGALEPERFESVISRHLVECDGARGDAHELEDTIVVKSAAELNNPGAYLFKYLGKSWDVDDMADYERRFAALLRETGRRRLRASDGGQRWMQPDEAGGGGDYSFLGIGRSEVVTELLSEYNDLEDPYGAFLIDHEQSVRSWLSERSFREVDGGFEWDDTLELSHEAFETGGYAEGWQSMRVLGSGPDGDRPPPG